MSLPSDVISFNISETCVIQLVRIPLFRLFFFFLERKHSFYKHNRLIFSSCHDEGLTHITL